MKCPRCGTTQNDRLYEVGFNKRVESAVAGARTRFKRKVCISCVKWFNREVDLFVAKLEKAVGLFS